MELACHACPLDRARPGAEPAKKIHAIDGGTDLADHGLRKPKLGGDVASEARIDDDKAARPILAERKPHAEDGVGDIVRKIEIGGEAGLRSRAVGVESNVERSADLAAFASQIESGRSSFGEIASRFHGRDFTDGG